MLFVYGNDHVKRTIREAPKGGEEEEEFTNSMYESIKCKSVCPVSGLASLLVLAHCILFDLWNIRSLINDLILLPL